MPSKQNHRAESHIYLAGGYTWHNKGDAALVTGLVSALRKELPKVDIVLSSITPQLDAEKFQSLGIETVPYAFAFSSPQVIRKAIDTWDQHIGWRTARWTKTKERKPRSRKWVSRLIAWAKWWEFVGITGARTLGSISRRHRRRKISGSVPSDGVQGPKTDFLDNASCVIFVPGGYLMAPGPRARNWLPGIFPIFIAAALKVPVFISPASVGPFYGFGNRLIAKLAFRIPNRVFVRERECLGYLEDIGVAMDRIRVTTDVAFVSKPQSTPLSRNWREQILGSGKLKVGISVRRFDFAASKNPDLCTSKYIEAFRKLLAYLERRGDTAVWFVSQNSAQNQDLAFAQELAETVESRQNIHYLVGDLAPGELQEIYGAFDVFVGVRMHANIFAMTQGVPTLAIAYQSKSVGIMKELNLHEWLIDIYSIEAHELIAKSEELIQQRDMLRNHIQSESERVGNEVKTALRDLAADVKGVIVEMESRGKFTPTH